MVEREAKFENGYFHTDRPSLIEITNCGSIKKRLTFIKAIFVKKNNNKRLQLCIYS